MHLRLATAPWKATPAILVALLLVLLPLSTKHAHALPQGLDRSGSTAPRLVRRSSHAHSPGQQNAEAAQQNAEAAQQNAEAAQQNAEAAQQNVEAEAPRPPTHGAHANVAEANIEVTSGLQIYRIADLHRDLLPPFVVEDAELTGVADTDAQAEFAAAGGAGCRTLLHGRRQPSSYSRCPRCTIISCSSSNGVCSGHCKTTRQLFGCRTRGTPGGICNSLPEELPDPTTLPADSMDPLDSAIVMTPAPFIGCANVTGVPDGCPAPGTTGALAGTGRLSVINSWCVQHLYDLPCASDDETRTPFFPFGYCQCLIQDNSGSSAMGPCRTSELDWSGPGEAFEGAQTPVSVFEEQGNTHTTFGITELRDIRTYKLEHMFTTCAGCPPHEPIAVTLQHYIPAAAEAFDLTAEAPL